MKRKPYRLGVVELELTIPQAQALRTLARNSAQDMDDIIYDRRSTAAAEGALNKLHFEIELALKRLKGGR